MDKLNRREFLKKASVVTAAGGASVLLGCGPKQEGTTEAPAVQSGKIYEWRMVTTWPPRFPVLGEGAELFAKWVETMSEGRMKIHVYGGGELVPALEAFDAVSQGVVEMAHSAILSAGGEIYINLERGVIDATEWIGPYHDYLMGFPKIASYYYYPGWHEPGTVLELFINKSALDALPGYLKEIIRAAARYSNLWVLSEFEAQNNRYLQKIKDEHKTQIIKFPDDVLGGFKEIAADVIANITAQDPMSKKVYESFSKFRRSITGWASISEKVYYTDF